MFKNVEKNTVIDLKNEIDYLVGQIISKTVAVDDSHIISLFSFYKDSYLATKITKGDLFIFLIEGKLKISFNAKEYLLESGEAIVISNSTPHNILALENSKALMTLSS